MEGDRFERENDFAGFVHRLDRVLKTLRGSDRPELAVGIYEDWHAFWTGFARNASEIGGRLGSLRANADCVRLDSNPFVADIDIVTARSEIRAGANAQGDIAIPGGVAKERSSTVSCVVLAGGVARERTNTGGRVVAAGVVLTERTK